MQFKDRAKRPRAVLPDLSGVPEELRSVRQWVLWRYDWSVKAGCWAKVPYSVSGGRASSTDSSTWSSFQSCSLAFQQSRSRFDGLGFVFSGDSPFVGIDLDECVTESGDSIHLSPFAAELVSSLGTYCELSPSQSGLHLIGRAPMVQVAKGTWQQNKIEIYRKDRYFTFSGISWDDEPAPVKEIGTKVKELISKIKSESEQRSNELTIERRIAMATQDANTKALFNGDISLYGDDHSRADLALCSKFAFYSGGDKRVLDEMFRKSQLFREKWDERHGAETYGDMTVGKAMDGKTSFLGSRQQAPAVVTPTESSRRLRRHTVDSLWDEAMEFREHGGSRGVDPGWEQLEKFYRPAEGLWTVVVGTPGSGKSTWTDCLVYNLAKLHGWRTTFASFETMPLQRHILNLCQIHLQKPTFAFSSGCATDREMAAVREAIGEWFNFILPDENEMDMASILTYVDDDVREYGVKGFVLDPFTEIDLRRTAGMSQVETIEQELRRLRQFTSSRSIHTWLLAHPTKSGSENYKKEAKGMRPTLYSAAGASHFNNKADYGLVIQRWDDDTVDLYVDKVRNDSTGGRGLVEFIYHLDRRAYEEIKEDKW